MKIELDFKSEDFAPLPPVWKQSNDAAMETVVSNEHDEIKAVLDSMLPGWTIEVLKRRCLLEIREGSQVRTLLLDGKPILEIHPLETSELKFCESSQSYKYKITQKFRRLPSNSNDSG